MEDVVVEVLDTEKAGDNVPADDGEEAEVVLGGEDDQGVDDQGGGGFELSGVGATEGKVREPDGVQFGLPCEGVGLELGLVVGGIELVEVEEEEDVLDEEDNDGYLVDVLHHGEVQADIPVDEGHNEVHPAKDVGFGVGVEEKEQNVESEGGGKDAQEHLDLDVGTVYLEEAQQVHVLQGLLGVVEGLGLLGLEVERGELEGVEPL